MDLCSLRNGGTGNSVVSCKTMSFKSVSFLFMCMQTSKLLRSFECGLLLECFVTKIRDDTQISGIALGSQRADVTRMFE
jgi:hypothetical protein